MFVAEIRPDTTPQPRTEDELIRNSMRVGQVNPMKYASIPEGQEAVTKVRYRDGGDAFSTLHNLEGDHVKVEFMANVKGICASQSAVFYEGDDVVGGGIIYR